MSMFLGVVQKKGKKEFIDGRLTVYAIVDIDPSEIISGGSPITSMVHNGLLVAQANYEEQNSLKDFFESEFGASMEEGLEEFLEKLDGLEGALDPSKLRDKLKNFDEIKDFIPAPARIVPFHNEESILDEEGDVYFVGRFKNSANANLCVNAFPILYQAKYREQQSELVKNEIDNLISQIESSSVSKEQIADVENVENLLNTKYIPNILYRKNSPSDLKEAVSELRELLRTYKYSSDVDTMVDILCDTVDLTKEHYRLLELFARKISLVLSEEFTEVEAVNKEINSIKTALGLN